jgi:hypothetical protein
MAKATSDAADLLDILDNRNKFLQVLTQDPAKLSMKTAEAVFGFIPKPFNTSYEAIGCVGFNPQQEELTATISIKRAQGYSGVLCSKGSYEYVRFYLDYGDGTWNDMGFTGVNVHDIPDTKDCDKKLEKPISYTLRLKINPRHFTCRKANLPKVRAVLCWNAIPPANDPNCTSSFPYLWADKKDVRVQIRPLMILNPHFGLESVGPLLEKAILNPFISINSLADFVPGGKEKLLSVKDELEAPKMEIAELAKFYKDQKLDVESHRVGVKLLAESIDTPDVEKIKLNESLFSKAGLVWKDSLAKLQLLQYNTSYEQIFCAGLDYHNEALVGTLQIKRPGGYGGDLCHRGSKEYVTFWIQSDGDCQWKQIGTASVDVHDLLGEYPKEGISYSVILPVDLSAYRKKCDTPVVLKLRAVLSWNTPASGFKPSYWGNVLDSYIQIRPGKPWDGKNPQLFTVGGVSVDNIDGVSGLTKAGAKIEINQTNTYTGSPFGGIIVVQALCSPFVGTKYRIRVNNLNTSAEYFVNNDLHLLGFNGSGMTHPTVSAVNNCYEYQDFSNNINSVVALWSPGTNDRLRITIENMAADGVTVTGSASQVIQMDSIVPYVNLVIDDGGDCSHYTKGSKITGSFTVNDAWLLNYQVSSPFGTVVGTGGIAPSGTTNGSGTFEIQTLPTSNPCGYVALTAYEKTIYNSVTTGNYSHTSRIICLK